MKRLTLCLIGLFLVGACGPGPAAHPPPTVATIGGDITCSAADHGFEDAGAGWGFCYPKTWRYLEKAQGYTLPTRLDLTFDITDLGVACVRPSPVAGATPRPTCTPSAGLFAFMIISTYERGSATDLLSWMQANLSPVPAGQPIQWGNATEASRLADGRRIALTPHHVVIMDLRSAKGQLDLEGMMSARLSTWDFLY
jgi:hypothetical protein